MNELKLTATKNTPEVLLHPDGVIRIKGRSIHENATEFYYPVESWISTYIESPADMTRVDIALEYFNSASAKIFIHLLQKLTYVSLKNKKFIFNWYYEEGDEDILERGEYFSTVLDVPFNFIRTA
ncbi:MAG TPA: DUF1987 domain-containing protein [Bacteroidales bacterium]|jgi:hypothetical protein|nr:DUF1987 domain-containing protein [Bacteroidales bacterium]